jgi:hypothetical protein
VGLLVQGLPAVGERCVRVLLDRQTGRLGVEEAQPDAVVRVLAHGRQVARDREHRCDPRGVVVGGPPAAGVDVAADAWWSMTRSIVPSRRLEVPCLRQWACKQGANGYLRARATRPRTPFGVV